MRAAIMRAVCGACLAVALAAAPGAAGLQPLAPPHSVSGFSGGASVAVNHLVAFSDVVVGLGIIGGSPYGCSQLPDCGNTCSGYQSSVHLENTSIPWNSWVDGLRDDYIAQRASAGKVAPLSHLADKPVYLFSGLDDVYVYQSVMRAVDYQFRNFSSRVKSEFGLYAAHSWVVDNETCSHPGAAAIGNKSREHAECCGIKGQVGACIFEGEGVAPYRPQGCCGTCSAGDVSSDSPGIDLAQSDCPAGALGRRINVTRPGFRRARVGDHRSTVVTTTWRGRYFDGCTAQTWFEHAAPSCPTISSQSTSQRFYLRTGQLTKRCSIHWATFTCHRRVALPTRRRKERWKADLSSQRTAVSTYITTRVVVAFVTWA